MKILVVGGGAREHALVWKLRRSPRTDKLYCAPGNAGIDRDAECIKIKPESINELLAFAEAQKIDLTVVGPELPLSLGIADAFRARGLAIFGSSKAATEIESSKVFSKEFMARHGIPTAAFEVAATPAEGRSILDRRGARFPVVLKADGLAAGKGVILAADRNEAEAALDGMLVDKRFGTAGSRVIIEDCLTGPEASFFVLTDGRHTLQLETCQDYKRLGDGDAGPNTGGMGGYSPSAHVDPALAATIMERVITPTVRGMEKEGRLYQGVLYAGLMLTPNGPQVLEYNARFGDPEAELLLARLETDLVDLIVATIEGRLSEVPLAWRARAATCVVLASGGYPGKYDTGKAIGGLERAADQEGVVVFHAATRERDGRLETSGGRVLTVTAIGANPVEATGRCYGAVEAIRFDGRHFRTDIAGGVEPAAR
jgi:phosphoribosylamine--glycine ligase